MQKHYGIVFLTLLILLIASFVSAQSQSGKFGMGLTVEGSKPGFIFSFKAGPTLTLEPSLFLGMASTDDNTQWHIVPGVGVIYQLRPGEDLRPLAGIRFGADILTQNVSSSGYIYNSTSIRKTYVDIFFGPVFGARYYFSDNFAVSGEFQISVIDTGTKGAAEVDRFSDALYITTTQLLAVYLYF